MSVFHHRPIDGVIPATLLAFGTDLEIDEVASRRHLRDVAATPACKAGPPFRLGARFCTQR